MECKVGERGDLEGRFRERGGLQKVSKAVNNEASPIYVDGESLHSTIAYISR